jgi:hypothetical protein
MEANVKAVMAEATEVDAELNGSSNICGMVVVDNRGLCIAAEGEGDPASAGVIFSLASQAGKIEQGEDPPVLQIQTQHQ